MAGLIDIVQSLLPDGYRIVQLEYELKNKMTPFELICPVGHTWVNCQIRKLEKNETCPTCNREASRVRMTEEEFRAKMAGMGYELIGTYVNSHTRTHVRCLTCGVPKTCLPYNIKDSCIGCRKLDRKVEQLENIKTKLPEGFCLEINGKTTKVTCNKGHVYECRTASVRRRPSCPLCAKNHRLSLEELRSKLDDGYSVEGNYVNESSQLRFTCSSGHTYNGTWNIYQRGFRCPECAGCKLLDNEEVAARAKARNLKWIGGEYKGVKSELVFECHNHPGTEIKRSLMMLGWSRISPCVSSCSDLLSGLHKEVAAFLEANGYQVSRNSKPDSTEIDILVGKYAIEFCGLKWHSHEHKYPMYHVNKADKIQSLGLVPIFIWEDEWKNKRTQIQSYLLHTIKEQVAESFSTISHYDGLGFFNQNHPIALTNQSNYLMVGGFNNDQQLVSICAVSLDTYAQSAEMVGFINPSPSLIKHAIEATKKFGIDKVSIRCWQRLGEDRLVPGSAPFDVEMEEYLVRGIKRKPFKKLEDPKWIRFSGCEIRRYWL